MDKRPISRRGFAKAVGGAVAPMVVPSSVLGRRAGAVAPSDQIVMGGIGTGVRGETDLRAFLSYREVRFVAVCDVRNERREAIKTMVDQRYQNRDCAMYSDQFELLAREDIDAVLIATGDRWHAPMSILAAQHGKDVYCEKPISMTIEETLAIAPAFRRYGRIFQAGCQRRNGGNFELAVELVHTGRLGKLQAVYANVGPWQSWPPLPHRGWLPPEPEPPKEVFDWDRWLGPAPWRPYNSRYAPDWGWVNVYDFHAGGILEWGSHTVDLCHWAAQREDTQPVEYVPEGDNNGPYAVHCRFADGLKLEMVDEGRQGRLGLGANTVRFVGEEGWVETGDSGKIEVSENLRPLLRPTTEARLALAYHTQDFLNCVRSRKQPRANAEVVANSHISCHAAYIAFQLGRKVVWDPVKKEFPGDEEANRLRARAMREPWRV
ncbi:MAG TPA: Gfo/Idh/MocA family oxidoreductase [Bryobacteraceae bacterium]|nr:Gfo/Idh/MocA family oxidoreductase [Bryobacteraceae bacterium]HPQ16386.1 Gfo/Idh/MocA family oxidoreductase [Bryobacteraceae bacterium]HPU72583.1 Gfo/Idh/MocA family oxidoreductase [Bryobacteraceae bacterium]